MHWTCLVDSLEHVCCRYRLRAFEPHLARDGVTLSYQTLPRSFWARQRLLASLTGQCVLLQRRLLDAWSWRVLRKSAACIAFDFDDAVWLRDSYAADGLVSRRRSRRFHRTIREADLILAGNAFLADAASRHSDPAKVHVVPTCVEPEKYALATHDLSSGVRLVWIGSSSTLHGLEQIKNTLDLIGAEHPNVELRVVCDRPLSCGRLPVPFWPWSEATEAHALRSSDIGISWLPDDDWSRGKCGLKVLQYMATGLPVVANSVGVHRDMIQPGIHGFLAESAREWVEAIATLVRSPHLRRQMGRNGRALVEEKFSVASQAVKLVKALRVITSDSVRRAVSA